MFPLFNSLLVLRFNLFFLCVFFYVFVWKKCNFFVPVTTRKDCCSVAYHCADMIKPSALLWCIKKTLTQTCTSLIHSFQSSTQGGIMKTLIGEQHLKWPCCFLELYIIFTEAGRQTKREKERGGDMKHDVCSGLLLEHCVNSSVASTVKHQ